MNLKIDIELGREKMLKTRIGESPVCHGAERAITQFKLIVGLGENPENLKLVRVSDHEQMGLAFEFEFLDTTDVRSVACFNHRFDYSRSALTLE